MGRLNIPHGTPLGILWEIPSRIAIEGRYSTIFHVYFKNIFKGIPPGK